MLGMRYARNKKINYEMRWGVIRPLFKIELNIGCLFVFLQLYVNIIFKAPYTKILLYLREQLCIKFFFCDICKQKRWVNQKAMSRAKTLFFFRKCSVDNDVGFIGIMFYLYKIYISFQVDLWYNIIEQIENLRKYVALLCGCII